MRTIWMGITLVLMTSAALAGPPEKSKSGFDLSQLDTTADPCVDFYQYACGGWRKANPIPADKSRWGRYDEMAERNRDRVRILLEEAADPTRKHSAAEKQVGDFYASCMDEKTVESLGAKPIEPLMKQIASVQDRKDLVLAVAKLHSLAIDGLFDLSPSPDFHDANQVIAHFDQAGISLPDRDYYIKSDEKSVERRAKYVEYVTRMFTLFGENAEQAAADAKTVLAVETILANAYMDRTLRRSDPKNLDHKMSYDELLKLAPNFELAAYLEKTGTPKFDSLNVVNPGFFKDVNAALETTPLEDWKTYLRWKVLRHAAPLLSDAFVQEDYHFNLEYMRGTRAMEPRWKRCVRAVDNQMGEASGRLFVDKYFGEAGKVKIRTVVNNILAALQDDIKTVNWMSEETRAKALAKWKAINTAKLGFPDKYRDYSSIHISRGEYFDNFARTDHFEFHRQLAKIGKPVDKTEWGMTPPTVNAYYDPQFNEIVFPAGILQPPMFGMDFDDAYSYGAIGRVAGHELTHGFDDEGRQFDAVGNLTDWWTKDDAKAFDERAACVADQYSEYSPVNDDKTGKPMYLNGKLTLGENVADNGGLRLAYTAYMKSIEGKERKNVDGFTPEQRVFLGYAVSRCENVTEQVSRLYVVTDPHSPGKFRLIGTVSNMPEFWQAFGCKKGQPMVRGEKACRVW